MDSIRKTVTVSCLIYVLYGFINWLELFVFIPPFPVKPFILIAFLIVYVPSLQSINELFSAFVFVVWLLSLIFVEPYFWEFFGDYKIIDFYTAQLFPFVFLISVMLFVLLIISIIHKASYGLFQIYLLLSVASLLVYITLKTNQISVYNLSVAIICLLFLIFYYFPKNKFPEELQKQFLILNGLLVINFTEQLTLMS